MDYNKLLQSISEIHDNPNVYKKGLVLEYTLEPYYHEKMDEHLYYKSNPEAEQADFQHRDTIEIDMAGIQVRIVKKDL